MTYNREDIIAKARAAIKSSDSIELVRAFEHLAAEQSHTPTAHDHSKEPMLWCETHQHQHIARMPRFTFSCKDCGWGQWYGDDAREHEVWTQENLREAHTTYEVEHVMRPLHTPTNDEREALRDEFRSYLGDEIYVCSRDHSAWSHSTMGLDDFSLASDDDEIIESLVDIALRRPVQGEPTDANQVSDEVADAAQIAMHEFCFGDEEPIGRLSVARQGWKVAIAAALRAAFATEQGGTEWGVGYWTGRGALFVDEAVDEEDAHFRVEHSTVYDFVVSRQATPWLPVPDTTNHEIRRQS